MLLFALVRAIEVFGEAAARISDETKKTARGVPWGAIVGMRNRIVHAYWNIDADIVWKTALEELPDLLPRLRQILSEEE